MSSFDVGIPVVNEVELLRVNISAIRASTIRPGRIIIVDNGDKSAEIQNLLNRLMTDTWMAPFPEFLYLRPNRNIGCAGSWNLIHKLTAPKSLVLLNADTEVASDTFEKLYRHEEGLVCGYGYGCFRIDHSFWEKIGDFDEAFYPVYFEDTDHRYRVKLSGLPWIEWEFMHSGIRHGKKDQRYQNWDDEKLRWLHERIEANKARYVAKWGGMHTEEKFQTPFGRPLDPECRPSA